MKAIQDLSRIHEHLLDDIASRFLLDTPEAELNDPIKLCFLTELAFWFYLDEYVGDNLTLGTIKFYSFAQQLLKHVKYKPVSGTVDEMLVAFRDFKLRVPTYGAIILNEDMSKVLLVQGFWHRASWGFPKGKIIVNEEPHVCAVREVLEETGYDISSIIDKYLYLELSIGEQLARLYIVTGVPESTCFAPKTKGEIKELRWFFINSLPAHKNDRNLKKDVTISANMFYTVMPFVKPLKEWINSRSNYKRSKILSTCNEQGIRNLNENAEQRRWQQQVEQAIQNIAPREKSKSSSSTLKKKDSQTKGRTKETTENINNQKFTFKHRPKGQQITSSETSQQKDFKTESSSFRSQAWDNFKLDKKAIFDALKKDWAKVPLRSSCEWDSLKPCH